MQYDTEFIYILKDPSDSTPCYVGRTTDPEARLEAHSTTLTNSLKERWVYSLKQRGLRPEMEIIETVYGAEADARERWWISQYMSKGYKLVNSVHVPEEMRLVVDAPGYKPKKEYVGVWLTDSQAEKIDMVSERYNLSRAAAIRFIIRHSDVDLLIRKIDAFFITH
jgi:hypothetical protein